MHVASSSYLIFIAAVFATTGAAKLLRPGGTAASLQAVLAAPSAVARPAALALAAGEVLLSLSMLSGIWLQVAVWTVPLLCIAFLSYTVRASRLKVGCGCTGKVDVPTTRLHVLRSAVLVALALAGTAFTVLAGQQEPRWSVAAVIAAAAAYLIFLMLGARADAAGVHTRQQPMATDTPEQEASVLGRQASRRRVLQSAGVTLLAAAAGTTVRQAPAQAEGSTGPGTEYVTVPYASADGGVGWTNGIGTGVHYDISHTSRGQQLRRDALSHAGLRRELAAMNDTVDTSRMKIVRWALEVKGTQFEVHQLVAYTGSGNAVIEYSDDQYDAGIFAQVTRQVDDQAHVVTYVGSQRSESVMLAGCDGPSCIFAGISNSDACRQCQSNPDPRAKALACAFCAVGIPFTVAACSPCLFPEACAQYYTCYAVSATPYPGTYTVGPSSCSATPCSCYGSCQGACFQYFDVADGHYRGCGCCDYALCGAC